MRATPSFVVSIPFVLAAACAAPPAAPAEQDTHDGAATFAELKSLVGAWEGTTPSGRTSRVAYRISAGDSALVETWSQSRGREALTIYDVDRGELFATHYCPKGNRVLLRRTRGTPSSGMTFELVDATNLHVVEQSHQREFTLDLEPDGSLLRSETYVANGASAEEIAATPKGATVTYRRVPTTADAG